MFNVLFGMTKLANHPHQVTSPIPWLFIVSGITMMLLFIRHEGNAKEPLLDMELVKRPAFIAANSWNFLYGASLFGVFSLTPYYATVVYGMSPAESGALLTPRSIAMIVASTLSSFWLIRKGYHKPMIIGALLVFSCLMLLGASFHRRLVYRYKTSICKIDRWAACSARRGSQRHHQLREVSPCFSSL